MSDDEQCVTGLWEATRTFLNESLAQGADFMSKERYKELRNQSSESSFFSNQYVFVDMLHAV